LARLARLRGCPGRHRRLGRRSGADRPTALGGETVYEATAIRNRRTFYYLRSRGSTGAVRTLFSDDVTTSGNIDVQFVTDHSYQASATDLALVTTTAEETGTDLSGHGMLDFGRRGSSHPVAVADCATDSGDPAPPPFDLDGSRLAVVGDAHCNGNQVRILPESGTPVTISAPAGVFVDAVDLAGAFVAYGYTQAGARHVVVLDSNTGMVRYAVSPSGTGFTLSVDGTLTVSKAASASDCSDGTIVYYTVAAPIAHPVPAAHPCRGAAVVDGAAVYFSGGGSLRRALLSGGPESTLVPGGIDVARSMLSATADRAVFTAPVCRGHALYEVPLTASSALPRRSSRYAVLRIRCPRGCHGEFELSLTRHLGSHTVADEIVALPPGHRTRSVRLRLDARTARRARRHRVTAYLFEFTQSRGHTVEHRRRVVLTQ